MTGISVHELGSNDYRRWDDLVSSSPQGTVFHTINWLKCNSDSLDCRFVLLGAFHQDKLVGGCCLYERNYLYKIKSAITSVPLTPYSGFLLAFSDYADVRQQEVWTQEIITALSDAIYKLGYPSITIINNPALTDIRPLIWSKWKSFIKYTYVLPLDRNIFASFSRNAKRNITKAQNENISISKEFNNDLMWDLAVKTYMKQNMTVPFEKKQLTTLLDMIHRTNIGEMWVASTQDGIPISGECIIWDKQGAYRWFAAADPDYLHTGATFFLLSEILQNLQSSDVNKIFMMAANTENLTKFALNFDPVLIPYYGVHTKTIFHSFRIAL